MPTRLNVHRLAGSGISPLVGPVTPNLESPETPKLNPFTAQQGLGYAVKDGCNQTLDLQVGHALFVQESLDQP
jgi:hypothetical protein